MRASQDPPLQPPKLPTPQDPQPRLERSFRIDGAQNTRASSQAHPLEAHPLEGTRQSTISKTSKKARARPSPNRAPVQDCRPPAEAASEKKIEAPSQTQTKTLHRLVFAGPRGSRLGDLRPRFENWGLEPHPAQTLHPPGLDRCKNKP